MAGMEKEEINMWQLNMAFCIAVGFGSFAWALKRTMDAEKKKKKA